MIRPVLTALALWSACCFHAGLAAPATIPEPGAEVREDAAAALRILVMLRLPPAHFRPDSAYGGGYAGDAGGVARRRLAAELASKHGLKLVQAWPMPAIGVDCFVMEKAGDAPVERALTALAQDPRVLWAQPVNLYEGMDDTADPLYRV